MTNELLKEFFEWTSKIEDKTLAGHNVQFDFNFLLEHFKFYNLKWPFHYKTVDLHSIYYFYLFKNGLEIPLKENVSALDLDTIISALQIAKRQGYHNALEDAKLTAKAFSILLKER